MLLDNGISKVNLPDADASALSVLARSGIEVMVGVPNDRVEAMSDYYLARRWVRGSVTRYLLEGVDVRYVAAGNMHLLSSYNGSFLNTAFRALQNIQSALNEAGVGCSIKATVAFNTDVYRTPDYNPVPSAGRFQGDISGLMAQIVQFLDKNGAPFTVNIYPFPSCLPTQISISTLPSLMEPMR